MLLLFVLGLVASNPIQRVIDAELAKIGAKTSHPHSVNLFSTLIALVESGFGTAVVPEFAITACRRSRVQIDRLRSPSVTVPFFAVTRMGGVEHELVPAFSRYLIEHMPT